MTMNPDVKVKWVAKLRDPETRQGQSVLCHKAGRDGAESFCCLGVLMEIAVEGGVIEPGEYEKYATPLRTVSGVIDDAYVKKYGGEESESGVLTGPVARWAGLTEVDTENAANPVVDGIHLAVRNDRGATFAEIADLIEEHL